MATQIKSYVGLVASTVYPNERTFITIEEALAALPADLTAVDEQHTLLLMNQEFSKSAASTISNICSATCFIEITTAPGASFRDHAGKATNPLRYNKDVGAAINYTNAYGNVFNVNCSYARISKLQFAAPTSGVSSTMVYIGGTNHSLDIDGCIFESSATVAGGLVELYGGSAGSTIRNSVLINKRVNTGSKIASIANGSRAINCTFAALNARFIEGVSVAYAQSTFRNCYVGNCDAPLYKPASATAPVIQNCATDSNAAGWTNVPWSATTFKSIAAGSHDLRLADSSPLLGAGVAGNPTFAGSPVDMSTDIYGNARGAAFDIGAWEYQAPSAPPTFPGPNIGNISATQGVAITTVNAAASFSDPGDSLTYSALGSWPAGITVNSSTGVIGGTTSAAAGTYSGLSVRATDSGSATVDSNTFSIVVVAETTPPTLTGPSGSATSTTTATLSVSTNESGGTLYGYVSTSPTPPSAAALKAGTGAVWSGSAAVAATGTRTLAATGLAESTSYYAHFLQTDTAGNESAIASSGAFTTPAAGDTTPPTLTSASGSATGSTTASASVTTNEATGTLYGVLTASSTAPSVAQVKAGQNSSGVATASANAAVTATGARTLNFTGLSASTSYWAHFVHRDGSGNDSAVLSTPSSFATQAPPDTTAPTLSAATGTATGETTATAGVSTNEGNGTLYVVATTSSTPPTATQVKVGWNASGVSTPSASAAVAASGVQSLTVNGLTAATTYWLHFLHRDAAGNDSAVLSTASSFTTSAEPDVEKPVLSAAGGSATSASTATGTVTTDEGNGVLYAVLSTSSTPPTATQIRAGQDSAGSAAAWAGSVALSTSGAKNFSATGLSASTSYTWHFTQRDVAGNDSAVASSSSLTTSEAVAATTVSITLTSDGVAPILFRTGLKWAFFDQPSPANQLAPVAKGSTGTTDGSGVFTVNIAGTSLMSGQAGWLSITDGDGTVNPAYSVFAGPVTVA